MQKERQRIEVGARLWEDSILSAVLIGVAALLAAWLLPAKFPVWTLVSALALLTGVTFALALVVTKSMSVALYLGAWGLSVAVWLSMARTVGPWHAPVITSLIMIVVVLGPAGAVVFGRYRDAIANEGMRVMRSISRR